MLAGHYATALVAKQKAPKGTLLYFLIASQLPDLLWLGFHYLGLEPTRPDDVLDVSLDRLAVDMIYSHDVLPILLWTALTAGVGYLLFRQLRVVVIGALLVLVHAASDYLGGFPHHVFGPDTPSVGTGWYYTAPYLGVAFEALYCVIFLAWFFYNDAKAGVKRTVSQRATIVGVFVFGVVFMFSVAKTSFRDLFGIPPFDVPFNTVVPAMILTYVPMIVILMLAMREPSSLPGRRGEGPAEETSS
ncbi:MAG: hypothetical protein AAF436_17345 [Myxococcota bacterium]